MKSLNIYKHYTCYLLCKDNFQRIFKYQNITSSDFFTLLDCVYFTNYLIENNSIDDIKNICTQHSLNIILEHRQEIKSIINDPFKAEPFSDELLQYCVTITLEICLYQQSLYNNDIKNKENPFKNIFGEN